MTDYVAQHGQHRRRALENLAGGTSYGARVALVHAQLANAAAHMATLEVAETASSGGKDG